MPMVESTAHRQGVARARFYRAATARRKWRALLALHLNTDTDLYLFTAHGEGYVTVNDRQFRQPLVVTSQGIRTDWPAKDLASLEPAHFSYFLDIKPEVLLLGTGARQQFARPELYRDLIQAGIAIEFMDTPAACRTYNILVAEDRKVVAAVLPS